MTLGGWARWISPAVGADGVTRTGAAHALRYVSRANPRSSSSRRFAAASKSGAASPANPCVSVICPRSRSTRARRKASSPPHLRGAHERELLLRARPRLQEVEPEQGQRVARFRLAGARTRPDGRALRRPAMHDPVRRMEAHHLRALADGRDPDGTAYRSAGPTTLGPPLARTDLAVGWVRLREQRHDAAEVALLRQSADDLAVELRLVAREKRDARRGGPGLAPTTCGRSRRGR